MNRRLVGTCVAALAIGASPVSLAQTCFVDGPGIECCPTSPSPAECVHPVTGVVKNCPTIIVGNAEYPWPVPGEGGYYTTATSGYVYCGGALYGCIDGECVLQGDWFNECTGAVASGFPCRGVGDPQ